MGRVSKEVIERTKQQQAELMSFLINKNWTGAWSLVKNIGIKYESDSTLRYLIFLATAKKFDPTRNNNFIHYYKNAIYYKWLAQQSSYDGDIDIWPDYDSDTTFNREHTKALWQTKF